MDSKLLEVLAQQVPGMVVLLVLVVIFLKSINSTAAQTTKMFEDLRADLRQNTAATYDLAAAIREQGIKVWAERFKGPQQG